MLSYKQAIVVQRSQRGIGTWLLTTRSSTRHPQLGVTHVASLVILPVPKSCVAESPLYQEQHPLRKQDGSAGRIGRLGGSPWIADRYSYRDPAEGQASTEAEAAAPRASLSVHPAGSSLYSSGGVEAEVGTTAGSICNP